MARHLLRLVGGLLGGLLGLVALSCVLVLLSAETVLGDSTATPAEGDYAQRFSLAHPAILGALESPGPEDVAPWLQEIHVAEQLGTPEGARRAKVARARLMAGDAEVVRALVARLEQVHAKVGARRAELERLAEAPGGNRTAAAVERLLDEPSMRAFVERPPRETVRWLEQAAGGAPPEALRKLPTEIASLLGTPEVQATLLDSGLVRKLLAYGEARRLRRLVAATAWELVAHHLDDAPLISAKARIRPTDDEARAERRLARWREYLKANAAYFSSTTSERWSRAVTRTQLASTLAALLPQPGEGRWLPALGETRDGTPVWALLAPATKATLLFALVALGLGTGTALALVPPLQTSRSAWRPLLLGGAFALAALPAVVLAAWAALLLGVPDAAAVAERTAAWKQATTGERLRLVAEMYALPVLLVLLVSGATALGHAQRRVRDALCQDFAQAARARGVHAGKLVMSHGMRPALAPWLRDLAASLPGMLGVVLLLEGILELPGLGRHAVEAIRTTDVPLALGVFLTLGTLLLLARFLLGVLACVCEPQCRDKRSVTIKTAVDQPQS